MEIKFVKPGAVKGAIVLQVSKGKLGAEAKKTDKASKGALANALKNSVDFKSKNGETISTMCQHLQADVAVLAGYEVKKESALKDQRAFGAKVFGKVKALKVKEATIVVEGKDAEEAANIAFGAKLKSYTFNHYFSKDKLEGKVANIKKLNIMVAEPAKASKAYKDLGVAADAVFFSRDLVSEPANELYPKTYAARIKKMAKDNGLKVKVLGEKEMKKLGMGSLLCVGQGSEKESQLVIMEWNGGKKGEKPLGFVGKGVTFDTGGISIKPSNGMWDMKYDMGGSATVVGLMKLLAERKAKVNAVGVVGLVENMPSGTAIKPGDVVKSMSGQTIEVLNTDAEGRLVLADALWYTQKNYKPQFMINLATLTGAIVVALGTSRAGIFSNNDKLAERLHEVGKKTGEDVWRLPISELGGVYDKQIDSPIADMQNIGADREAGSITAAQFLQRFVNDVPWTHIDIAGMAWADKEKDLIPKGASGYGVVLLNELVKEYYEK